MRGILIIAFAFACANAAAQDAISMQPTNAAAQAAPATAPIATPNPAQAPTSVPSQDSLAAGLVIPLVSDKEWSSTTLKQGDTVTMHVSEDVMLEGRIVIPSGTPASGEVIDSQSGGAGGTPGKLSISARAIQLGDRLIALRSRLSAGNGIGKDRSNVSMAVGVAVGVFGLFVHGGDVTIPAGTSMSAKLAQDTSFAAVDSHATLQP